VVLAELGLVGFGLFRRSARHLGGIGGFCDGLDRPELLLGRSRVRAGRLSLPGGARVSSTDKTAVRQAQVDTVLARVLAGTLAASRGTVRRRETSQRARRGARAARPPEAMRGLSSMPRSLDPLQG